MTLSRTKTYFLLLGLCLCFCLLYQGIWLISGITMGRIVDFGRGSGRGYRSIENVEVAYEVDYHEYTSYYLRNGIPNTIDYIPIKYLLFAPSWSRMNTTTGNWGFVLVFICVTFSILTVIFLQKAIIPFNAQFIISKRFPFLKQQKAASPFDE